MSCQCTIPYLRILLDEGRNWSTDKAGVAAYIDRIRSAGFNAIMPCIWHGAGTTWNSDVEPVRDALYQSSFDAFDVLLKLCKRYRIICMPWFCVSIAQRAGMHPEWALNNGTITDGGDAHYSIWDNDFRGWINTLVDEFTGRYAIDGMFLDFTRSGTIYQTTPGRVLYAQDTGRDWANDFALWVNSPGRCPHMSGWIERYVTSLMREIVNTIKRNLPNAKQTAYGRIYLGNPASPANQTDYMQGRRIREWLEAGLIDYIFNTDYNETINFSRLREEKECVDPRLRKKIIGLIANYVVNSSVQPMNAVKLVQNIEMMKKFELSEGGIAIYLDSHLTAGQVTALAEGPFKR